MTPLLSVVVPVLNAPEALERTLASCSDADWLEVLIQDATPGATSQDLGNAQRIAESDRGIYDAMNRGRLRASGRFICFAGAGDVFTDLEGVRRALESANPELHVFGTRLQAPREPGVPAHYPARWDASLKWRHTAHHQGVFYRTDALPRMPFDDRWAVLADYALHLALWRAGARAKCHDIAAMSVAPAGVSRRFSLALYQEEWQLKQEVMGRWQAMVQIPWIGAKWAYKQWAQLRRG